MFQGLNARKYVLIHQNIKTTYLILCWSLVLPTQNTRVYHLPIYQRDISSLSFKSSTESCEVGSPWIGQHISHMQLDWDLGNLGATLCKGKFVLSDQTPFFHCIGTRQQCPAVSMSTHTSLQLCSPGHRKLWCTVCPATCRSKPVIFISSYWCHI